MARKEKAIRWERFTVVLGAGGRPGGGDIAGFAPAGVHLLAPESISSSSSSACGKRPAETGPASSAGECEAPLKDTEEDVYC